MDKDSIKDSEDNTFNLIVSEEAPSKKVEKESAEMIKTNGIMLSCELCKYKCKNKNTLTKHMDSKHKGHNNLTNKESLEESDETDWWALMKL